MRKSHIEIRGARQNNLRGIDVDIPRDRLVAVTGMSGSGKSSLAFDTLYAEGQRKLMASMSAYAKRFVRQLEKPDVDFVNGLSPVVSIDQKTVGRNPRSTVGTMTDIWDYLRMLYATLGQPHCPRCSERIPVMSTGQMAEHILGLPDGTQVEALAPVTRPYGEDWEATFELVRHHGYRYGYLDGERVDLGDERTIEEGEEPELDAVVDTFVVAPRTERAIIASLEEGAKLGDGLLAFPSTKLGCAAHHTVARTLHHGDFTFNDPAGACKTCAGLGRSKRVHPPLLVPDPSRSLWDGAIVPEAFKVDKNNWSGRIFWSLKTHFGLRLDVPWSELTDAEKHMVFYGVEQPFAVVVPPDARMGQHYADKELRFTGVVNRIEQNYHWYRKQGESNAWMETYLDKVMVEFRCPDCDGARLRKSRRMVTIGGKALHDLARMHLVDLLAFLEALRPTLPERVAELGGVLLNEVTGRLRLLVDIGLDYLSLDREAGTLSGGESQRIRLSTQIGSGLMGMLYVLDEPSIGLHAKDNAKMIATLRKLVDLGNTVVVVEHDPDTILAADHVLEIGPGPGVHGGTLVATGSPDVLKAHADSLTGAFLSGRRQIAVPKKRRKPSGWLKLRGCRHNNLQSVDVDLPLGVFCCVTGASGSGKSSLVHDTLHAQLIHLKRDSRRLAGEHDDLTGHELVDDMLHIDQTALGYNSRSNPATYIGIFDRIRKLFANAPLSKERGYKAGRFSFNVKGGRCEECQGDGTITTKLSFMPDVEVTCPVCKGQRYNADTLEVELRGKNIAEVLDLSIEDAVAFFADDKTIKRKIGVLDELGLGYLTLGQPAPILSGGEAQRVKLGAELGKLKRGKHLLYILDEPTTGLHMADIQRLLDALSRLVDAGHTVLVIEHNLDVIKTADYIVDLGPEGGHKGGLLLATGTPEQVAATDASHTGRFLRDVL